MKINWKYTLIALLAAITLLNLRALSSNMAEEILDAGEIKIRDDYSISVDGKVIRPDVPPVERGGVIFIPLRFAAEALNPVNVEWDKVGKVATVEYPGNRFVRMTIGDKRIDMGDKEKYLQVAPFIFQSRTMIPLKPTVELAFSIVQETENEIYLQSEEEVRGAAEESPVPAETDGKVDSRTALENIRNHARNDDVTKKLKPYVLTAWAIAGALWLIVTLMGMKDKRPGFMKGQALILFMLTLGVFLVLKITFSTYWAAIVIIGTAIIGTVSTESYTDRLVTMASSAQGFGLICTLFGLGLLIGPAIANTDIEAIGYGIYVKIEPTVTGLTISMLMNMLFGYEARNLAGAAHEDNGAEVTDIKE